MATKDKLRNIILNKVKNLSEDKLSNLDSFLNDLESQFGTEESALSFNGIFRDIDIDELTTGLHEKRMEGDERIPEF